MKVVMINDCAYVGETLIKYLPKELEVVHLKRSRGFLSKTFGILWKIMRSKGDVYHVHYLLQDCYLALKFGKQPVIGHAHGTDLRSSLKHKIWSRFVRYNLERCEKILVSTPDLLSIAREYREDAEYIPNPVDTNVFYPKPVAFHGGEVKVLIAAKCDWKLKGTDIALYALGKLKDKVKVFVIRYGRDFDKTVALARELNLNLEVLPKISHEKMCKYYWMTDVVIDQFKFGVLGMVSLEAIACGRPVITFVSSEYASYKDFPIKDIKTQEDIIRVFNGNLEKLWRAEYKYLKRNHDPEKVATKLAGIYKAISSA